MFIMVMLELWWVKGHDWELLIVTLCILWVLIVSVVGMVVLGAMSLLILMLSVAVSASAFSASAFAASASFVFSVFGSVVVVVVSFVFCVSVILWCGSVVDVCCC